MSNKFFTGTNRLKKAKIIWYNRSLGYGFAMLGHTKVFFHHSKVLMEGFSSKTPLKSGKNISIEYKAEPHKGKIQYVCTKVVIK